MVLVSPQRFRGKSMRSGVAILRRRLSAWWSAWVCVSPVLTEGYREQFYKAEGLDAGGRLAVIAVRED